MTARVRLQQVVEIQGWFAKELVSTLLFETDQAPLNGPDAGGGYIAILSLKVVCILANVLQHGLQVFQIEQKQAIIIRNLKNEREYSRLSLVKIEQTTEQERPHFRDRGAHRVALFGEDIPERHRAGGECEIVQLEFLRALDNLWLCRARLADSRQIPLHICRKYRYPDATEGLGHHLQGDGLTGSGRARNQSMAVGILRKQIKRGVTHRNQQRIRHRSALRESRRGTKSDSIYRNSSSTTLSQMARQDQSAYWWRRAARNVIIAVVVLACAAASWKLFSERRDLISHLSIASAYPALLLLAATLLLGPWNLLRRRPNPISFDLRRDLGIWAGITAVFHTVIGLNVHLRGRPWLYFIDEHRGLRHDLFGFSNDTGLFA